jgi:hypothetical protein
MERARERLERLKHEMLHHPVSEYREAARREYESAIEVHTKPTARDLRPVVFV